MAQADVLPKVGSIPHILFDSVLLLNFVEEFLRVYFIPPKLVFSNKCYQMMWSEDCI